MGATLCDIAFKFTPIYHALDSISFAYAITEKDSLPEQRRQELGIWGRKDNNWHEALLTERFKFIHYPKNGTVELYDLENDVSETNDLSGNASYNDMISNMKTKLHQIG